MTHPLFEGTRDLVRRFREERRVRKSLSAEEFLDLQTSSPAYPAGIERAQWTQLFDAMRNARASEVDELVREWLEQLPQSSPAGESATLPLEDDGGGATLVGAAVPAQDAQFIDRRYRILRVLGEGAFGKVFLVADKLQNDQQLALKLIKKEHTATSAALVRFKNEILLLRVLNHPGIPQIFNDGISEDGEFYYTMAYVAGRTLDDVIRKEAPLEPLRIVRITKQIIDVLDYAHARGAIHRDLKPGNIFLLHAGTPQEAVRVLDFGIAKVLSREGILEHAQTMNTEMPLGTPHYMSPEQVRGTEVDGRTDLYALGVILYQMCSGRFPFSGKTLMEILAARLEKPATPLVDETTPAWLRELVMKLLEREREARPDTTAIRATLDQLSSSQREVSRKLTWIGAAVFVVACVLGWIVFKGGAKSDSDELGKVERGARPSNEDRKLPLQGAENAGKPESPPKPIDEGKEEGTNENATPNPAPLDSDGDGTADVNDDCPNDKNKTKPGRCGCGEPETDTDGDGTPNCVDECPNDKDKTKPGLCGCGVPETDKDGDGHPDCVDRFPNDKTRWSEADEIEAAAQAAANRTTPGEPAPSKAPKIPQGFTAASDSTIDARSRPTSIVHEKTGIVLDLVDAGPASFYLGRYEVTREQWSRGPDGPQKNTKLPDAPTGEKSAQHPAVNMDLENAKDFCERLGLRLPTTGEWELAAALGGGHVFPWGETFVAGSCNSNAADDHFPQTAPVGSFPSDRCGPFFDMAGNAQEWCVVDAAGKAALRGGGWRSPPNACKLKLANNPPALGNVAIGFRVALSCEP